MKRICIIDLAQTAQSAELTALLQGLTASHPDAATTLVTTEEGKAAREGLSLVNELMVFTGGTPGGLPAAYERASRFVNELRTRAFGSVINLGSGRAAAVLARLINCPDTAGATLSADWMPVVRGEWPAYLAACRREHIPLAFHPTDIMRRIAGEAPIAYRTASDQPPIAGDPVVSAVWRTVVAGCLDRRPTPGEEIDASIKLAVTQGQPHQNSAATQEAVVALHRLAELCDQGGIAARKLVDHCTAAQTQESRPMLQALAGELAEIDKKVSAHGRAMPHTRPIAALFSIWTENIEAQSIGGIAVETQQAYSRTGELARAMAQGLVRAREHAPAP
jgi:hypothetical protein